MSQQDLTVIRGDSAEFTLTLSGLDEYGLIGADLWFTAGTIEKRLGDGIEVEDEEAGTATITLEPDDTAGAPGTRSSRPYDVQVRLADGRIRTPVRGRLIIIPDVTTATE